jgi:hypothetical protein
MVMQRQQQTKNEPFRVTRYATGYGDFEYRCDDKPVASISIRRLRFRIAKRDRLACCCALTKSAGRALNLLSEDGQQHTISAATSASSSSP